MNFINKYRRSNLQSRRGMILLVVMAVLSFFAVLGMTFILMTGKNRDSAETAQLAAQNSKTAGNSPQELLEEGIMQVLAGPPSGNTNSALYLCDLIGDMYGDIAENDDNLEVVTSSFNNNKMSAAKAEYAGRVVTIAEGPYKGQSTLILNSRGYIVPFASGIGNTEEIPDCKCVINKKRAFQGGNGKVSPAMYDVVDIGADRDCSNDFMSLRFTGATDPNIDIKVGRVIVPSYYRGDGGGVRPGLTDNSELGGTASGYNNLSSASFKTAASTNDSPSPWDVDNDGDGDNDSVWMNLGLPPRPMPDGTLVVPMYAILVEDMDGRLNVNTHSPDNLTTVAGYTSLGSSSPLPNNESLDPTTMLNGQGLGPAEINMDALLGKDAVTDIVNARTGNAAANTNFFKYRFPFGEENASGFSPTQHYKTFRTPSDFYGVMAGTIDQNGMFIWQKRGTVGDLDKSSYERDLGYAYPKGERVTAASSQPFSPEELEGVLRVYDDDSQKLESRLLDIVRGVKNKNKDAVRNLITTESWDMPYCDISGADFSSNNNLPEEIQAGFKLDINRPLTSYENDPDGVADAERTQLAKDLYLIAKACVGQSKAAAQWAVNAVDFRDADSVCTHLSIDGYDVWGCERPELLITETFAFHARMTEDSELGGWRSNESDKCARPSTPAVTYIDAEWYDKEDCPDKPDLTAVTNFCEKYDIPFEQNNQEKMNAIIDLMDRVKKNNSDGIADMDQVYKPESGLFIELYNPWLSAEAQESVPANEYKDGGVLLGSGGSMQDSAWRIVVAGGKAAGISENDWAEDLREKNYTKNRVLYFGSDTPDTGEFTYSAGTGVCVKPGQTAVIGPSGNTVLARLEAKGKNDGQAAREIQISESNVIVDGNTCTNVCPVAVPDCEYARFSVTDIGTYTGKHTNGHLDTPLDMPYDSDDNDRWTNLDGAIGKGLGDDFEQEGYRIVYLQRLANPFKPYNETDNPYITFDQMPVDLYCYNGRQTKYADYKNGLNKGDKPTEELQSKHGDAFVKSRQRGETQMVKSPSGLPFANLWNAEKIPAVTTTDAVSKLNSYTMPGKIASMCGLKKNFYQSFSQFDEKLYDLVSTGSGTSTAPSYKSAPSYYFPNRPFNSVMELMLVPQVSAYELTSSENAIDKPLSPELKQDNLPKYLHPENGIDFLSDTGSKIFNYVRVQTPFVVTPMNLNTFSFGVSGSTATSNYRWSFREPGKININSISNPAVWAALLGVDTEDKPKSISGLPSATMYNDYWGNVFNADNPGERPQTFGNKSSYYVLTKVPGSESCMFRMNNTTVEGAKECQSAANNVYFQTQLMQRLSNLTTTRSNVFAVWVTVGFFEYQGATIGKEYGLDNGSRQRYRAFYIIDRTRPVGYSPGKRMNADKTIILRRYLP